MVTQKKFLTQLQTAQAQGDENLFFSILFNKFQPYIISQASTYFNERSAIQAKDICQDIFEKLWKKGSEKIRTNSEEELKGFFKQVVKNTCINSNKKKSNTRKEELADQKELTKKITTNTGLSSLISNDLRMTLNYLTTKQKEAYLLYIDGWQLKEIADKLNIKETTAKNRVFTAKKKLKEIYKRSHGILE